MRKAVSYLQGSYHKTVSWLLNRNFAGQKGVSMDIQSDEKQGSATTITQQSYPLEWKDIQRASQTRKSWRNSLPPKFYFSITWNVKGSSLRKGRKKNMNNQMAIYEYLSATESKNQK